MGALLNVSDIYAELQDPAAAAQALRRYEAEMVRRFGPRECWPKPDSDLSAEERSALEAKQLAYCEMRERKDEKRRRRMARIEARRQMTSAPNDMRIVINTKRALVRISDPLPEPPFLLRGPAPIPFGTSGGLIAEGGTSKSTLTLWEAVHIALGRPLFGHIAERPGSVLHVTAEDDRPTMNYRLQRIVEAQRLSAANIALLEQRIYIEDLTGKMWRLICADERGNLMPTDLGDRLIEAYKGRGLVLINIDPTNLFGPGERYVNDAEASLMVEGQRIAREIGCTVRFVHHTSKMVARGGIVDQYVGRGGAAFADNSRFQHQLVCHRADDAEYRLPTLINPADDFELKRAMREGRVLRLHTNKLSWGPRPLEPVWLIRKGFEFIWVEPSKFVSAQAHAAQQALQAQRRVVRFVQAQAAAGTKLSEREIAQGHFGTLKLTRARTQETLTELIALGHLKRVDLPKEERRGQRKQYLAVGDVPMPEDEF